jgi:ATP-dependent DNA helicase Rep
VQLNPAQLQAVHLTQGQVLVLAGAGSGKTRVITEKIAYLIEKEGHNPKGIYAVTFTNKAAKEMQHRLSQRLGEAGRGVQVSTFHTLGLDICRREYKALGIRHSFSLFDDADSMQLLRELSRDDEVDSDRLKTARHAISLAKNRLQSPQFLLENATNADEAYIARLYAAYQESLQAYSALDFDDLIARVVWLFQSHPDIHEKWRHKVRYLLVDEYQDTNPVQFALMKLLAGTQGHFTCVGDDDQSIYAWRGAAPEILSQLQADYPALTLVKLEQNYRSSARILQAANQLITNNPHLFIKTLWCDRGLGDKVRILACPDETTEAERIVSELLVHKIKNQTHWRDYAILYRSNHQARLVERALREQEIPYSISGGQSFFDRIEIKDVLAYLRLLDNPDDDAAFLRIANTPKRDLGPQTLSKLSDYAKGRGVGLLAACSEFGLTQVMPERAMIQLIRFSEFLARWRPEFGGMELPNQLTQFLTDLQYEVWLMECAESPKKAVRQWEAVLDLLKWIGRLVEKHDGAWDLSEIVRHLTLMNTLERQADEKEKDEASLMTLHAAKGLEFGHVFLMGMEEGILPHQNSMDAGDVEEERRLAYVGITRAERSLTISYARTRKRYGEQSSTTPSRFLDELPLDDIYWEGKDEEADTEVKAQTAANHLAAMRAMLGT